MTDHNGSRSRLSTANLRIVVDLVARRWRRPPAVGIRHPDRVLVSPAHFVPIAEELGLIVEIGEPARATR